MLAFRTADGRYELRRPLDRSEKTRLTARRNELVDNLMPARTVHEFQNDLLQMLMGFGGKVEADDAAAITAQYSAMLTGLPAWAVRRACQRWGMGQVTPEEIGAKTINFAHRPSSAQVRQVAFGIVQPFTQELARINKTLNGIVQRPEQTPEERERTALAIRQMADETMARLDQKTAEEQLREAQERARMDRRARDEHEVALRREYEARGLSPPPGPLVSLPFLLRMGWTIESDGKSNFLVRPGAA